MAAKADQNSSRGRPAGGAEEPVGVKGVKDYTPRWVDDGVPVVTTKELVDSVFIVEDVEFFTSRRYNRDMARVLVLRERERRRWITSATAILNQLKEIENDLPVRVKLVYRRGQTGRQYLSFTAPSEPRGKGK